MKTLSVAFLVVQMATYATGQCTAPCTKGQQYYAQECIAQPAQDCSVKANNNCPSCGLYNQDALPYVNQNDYHITLPGSVHSLAVPTHPCRGVENWTKPHCGEAIWDAAWQQVTGAQRATKGFAINPTSRRTMHQMHVHIADIQPDLQKVLYQIANNQDSWTYVDCQTTPNHQALHCKTSTAPTGLQAKWFASAGDPSTIKPFQVTYTNNPGPSGKAADYTLLVSSPTPGGFVVLEAKDRSAECLLTCGADCEGKCTS